MSVLIKGMEMPKNCGECQFCHTENFTIYCCPTGRGDILYDAIPEWCPLVQMPHITDEQISEAFQVAIVNYWEEKSKYLTPPSPCCDPKNKMEHGEWIDYQDDEYSYLANCSKCGYQMNTHEEHGYFNFCPNCGKAMRPRILDESIDGEGKDGNVKEGESNE